MAKKLSSKAIGDIVAKVKKYGVTPLAGTKKVISHRADLPVRHDAMKYFKQETSYYKTSK